MRSFKSSRMARAIKISSGVNRVGSFSSQADRSSMDSFEMAMMDSPATVTARLSGRRRVPAQSGQVWEVNSSESFS